MRIWRLVPRRHARFDGEGARLFGGRWNRPGTPVIYLSATISLAALEYFVHLEPGEAPDDLVVIQVDVPEGIAVHGIDVKALPRNWRVYPAPEELAELGSAWVHNRQSALLRLPSVIVPREFNYALNPAHRDFGRITVGTPEPFSLDPRLLKRK